jgi:hypothetical protein
MKKKTSKLGTNEFNIRGIIATSTINSGSVILEQKASTKLTLETVNLLTVTLQKRGWNPIAKHITPIAVYLFFEVLKNNQACDFVLQLPKNNHLLTNKSNSTTLYEESRRNVIAIIKKEYALLCRFVPSFFHDQYIKFVWCYSMIFSRKFEFGMIPHLDMVNHSCLPNAYIQQTTETIKLRAINHISPGTEITINYGKESTAKLFLSYGFLPWPQTVEFDETVIYIDLKDYPELSKLQKLILGIPVSYDDSRDYFQTALLANVTNLKEKFRFKIQNINHVNMNLKLYCKTSTRLTTPKCTVAFLQFLRVITATTQPSINHIVKHIENQAGQTIDKLPLRQTQYLVGSVDLPAYDKEHESRTWQELVKICEKRIQNLKTHDSDVTSQAELQVLSQNIEYAKLQF